MIEEYFFNYGVLGIWTLSLILEKLKFQKQIQEVLENNNRILLRLEKTLVNGTA